MHLMTSLILIAALVAWFGFVRRDARRRIVAAMAEADRKYGPR